MAWLTSCAATTAAGRTPLTVQVGTLKAVARCVMSKALSGHSFLVDRKESAGTVGVLRGAVVARGRLPPCSQLLVYV